MQAQMEESEKKMEIMAITGQTVIKNTQKENNKNKKQNNHLRYLLNFEFWPQSKRFCRDLKNLI